MKRFYSNQLGFMELDQQKVTADFTQKNNVSYLDTYDPDNTAELYLKTEEYEDKLTEYSQDEPIQEYGKATQLNVNHMPISDDEAFSFRRGDQELSKQMKEQS